MSARAKPARRARKAPKPTKPVKQASRDRSPIGLERVRGTYTAIGYRAARVATSEGRTATTASSPTHERISREQLQAQSREFMRDNGLYAGMLRRAVTYVVGTGFQLQCKTADNDFNNDVEKRWRAYCQRPDVTRQLSFRRLERLVAREVLGLGETGVVLADRGLQCVEAEQIARRAGDQDGIERDEAGAPIAYNVCPYGPAGNVDLARATRYTPAQFLYLAHLERPSSRRGVPPAQAAFAQMHRLDDILNAEAIAWQMQARIAITITRASGLPIPGTVATQDPDKANASSDGDLSGKYVTELDYALIFHGEQGDEVKGLERTAPARDFATSVRTFLRLLGLPLGLPLEITMLDWTQSNYSQSRAVLDQVAEVLAEWQDLLEDGFHAPVFRWWLQREIDAGRIKARAEGDAFEHEWIKPKPPWLDKLKEAQAYGEQCDRGFTTYAAVCTSLDTDKETVRGIREREVVEAMEAAERVRVKTGILPPWQMFCGLKIPTTAPAAAVGEPGEANPEDEGPKPSPSSPPAEGRPDDGENVLGASRGLLTCGHAHDALAEKKDEPAPAPPAAPTINVNVTIPERETTIENNVTIPERETTIENNVTIPEREVHVTSGDVHVEAPVTIEAPAAPDVTVNVDVDAEIKGGAKTIKIQRDSPSRMTGTITPTDGGEA